MKRFLGLFLSAVLFSGAALAINTSGQEQTYFNSALSGTAAAVKTSPALVYGYSFVNLGASDAYVQFFDAATGSVTPGSTTPKFSLWIPAGGGFEEKHPQGISFGTAVSIVATTTATGGSAPATAIVANVEFK